MKTALEQLIEYSENVLKHSTINAHLIIEKAKQLLSAEKKQIEYASQSKWISVEERLPEPFIVVLTTNGNEVRAGFYDSDFKKIVMRMRFQIRPATHWQPLPSPPKTEK